MIARTYDKFGRRTDFQPKPYEPSSAHELKAVEEQILLLKRQKVALEARDKLLSFTKFRMPDPADPNNVDKSLYVDARHQHAIARVLEEVEKGVIPQLILTMPPRHGKTELATKSLSAWFSGRNPALNLAVASYSDVMAEDYGADVRAILNSPPFKQVFPNYRLRKGGNAKDRIQTREGGLLVFVGRGGALTGRGAHLLIIDDIIKDAEEARSTAIRDQAWNWFNKVAMTRRMGHKLVIIIMTRWHEDDIVGRLTDSTNPHYNALEAAKWRIINFPAIAESDDPLGRQPGEPLWPDGPDKFDLEFLQSQQRRDPLGFAALYQQRPTVEDGVLIRREHIQYYTDDQLPADLRIYAASDHAVGKDRVKHDATVLLTVGVDRQGNIYLLDCFWERAATDRVVEAMLQMGGLRKPLIWWAERGHISKSIGPFLKRRMQETNTFFQIVEVSPVSNKEQRAQSIAARIALGMVYFPKNTPWTQKAIDELLKFPNGRNDDFVDALAYIGLGLRHIINASPASQLLKIPKFGTLGWVRHSSKMQELERKKKYGSGF